LGTTGNMRGDARLPVGWNRPHNPKVPGSNPAPQLKNRRPYRHLTCRACAFSVSGSDPKGVGLQAVSFFQASIRVTSATWPLADLREPCAGLSSGDHGLTKFRSHAPENRDRLPISVPRHRPRAGSSTPGAGSWVL